MGPSNFPCPYSPMQVLPENTKQEIPTFIWGPDTGLVFHERQIHTSCRSYCPSECFLWIFSISNTSHCMGHIDFFFFNIYLFIWLHRVLVAARGIFLAACRIFLAACMWDLVPWPGIKPGPPALGARSLNHWTTREVPGPHRLFFFLIIYLFIYLFIGCVGSSFLCEGFL